MMTAKAEVATELAPRYLTQLCKHFEHRIPVEYTSERGSIRFEGGVCRLAATDHGLDLEVVAADAETVRRLADVVARHLARFAFREPPTVAWSAPAPAPEGEA